VKNATPRRHSEGAAVKFHLFVIWYLDWVGWWASRYGIFTPGERSPIAHWIGSGETHSQSGRSGKRKFSVPFLQWIPLLQQVLSSHWQLSRLIQWRSIHTYQCRVSAVRAVSGTEPASRVEPFTYSQRTERTVLIRNWHGTDTSLISANRP
jgi:hypothetical protein